MHSGHDATPQCTPHIFARRVCRGAAAPASGKTPQQTQGRETGSSQTEGVHHKRNAVVKGSMKLCLFNMTNKLCSFCCVQLTKNGTQESEEAEKLTVDDIPEQDIDISGANVDEGSFLQPYTSKRRYALLKAAGVKKIDKEEKRQLHELRLSRENCGCDCQGFCEPETCSCSLAGIKCQVRAPTISCYQEHPGKTQQLRSFCCVI